MLSLLETQNHLQNGRESANFQCFYPVRANNCFFTPPRVNLGLVKLFVDDHQFKLSISVKI